MTAPVPISLAPCCVSGIPVGVTMKLLLAMAVPPDVVTDTAPVAAPGMTIPTSVVPVSDTEIAATPPMLNAVGLLRLVPVMVWE